MSDYGHGHGQETEAAPQSLHLNHLLFFFAFFFFVAMYPRVREQLCYSLCPREICVLLQGQRPILLTNLTRAFQTSASDPWHPSIRCKLPTLAQEPLPEVTGRSYGQFCPPGVQAALGKSCLSLYSRTLKLLKSVLMDTASPAVRIVLCIGNHCPPGALVENRLPRIR